MTGAAEARKRIVFMVLMLLATTSSGLALGEAPAIASNDCESRKKSQCSAAYLRATKQCTRYFLARTEAYSLCHNSAQERKDICANRGLELCAQEPTAPSGGESGKVE